MAETLPRSSPLSFNIDRASAVIEWFGVDSKPRYLYHGGPDKSREVTFELHFDAASSEAFFKICVAVGLKAAGPDAKTPLYLYIYPDRITSLRCDVPDAVPDLVTGKLGPSPSCFQFSLTRAADMIVPCASLVPRNKGHGINLESLKLLAQETCFRVYWTDPAVSEGQLQPLCDAITARTLKSINAAADLQSLYRGTGGKVLEGAGLCTPVPQIAPPSYGELEPSLPRPHDNPVVKPSRSKKRRRDSASSATDGSGIDLMACKKMLHDMMSRHLQEERAHFDSQLKQLKTSLKEDLGRLKSEMLEHVDQRISDLKGVLCSKDDLDEHISEHVSSFEDLIDVKVEDYVTGIRIELEELVDDEVANAEERVLQRVRDASWTIAIDE